MAAPFDVWCRRATGYEPWPYQRRLAEEGMPAVLRVPTGAGKTVAAVLPWLYRRREHPDEAVRAATPCRLVLAFPLRTLVEQTANEARTWIDALGLGGEVRLEVLLGGEGRASRTWQRRPGDDTILVGTVDMLLSRALNRGYAMSRYNWPIDFALLSEDVQWVFDEVQLMGAALPTSRQLQAFRDQLGTFRPTRSMWMSATVDDRSLQTVDAPQVGPAVELGAEDLAGELGRRVHAGRRVERLTIEAPEPSDLVAAVLGRHREGHRTLVVLNTVRRAQDLHAALLTDGCPAEVVLVHSRFRPPDRATAITEAIGEPGPAGTIVVTTQALEAGVDISSAVLVTETAPWPSIVQRAGRCNRYGEQQDAVLCWFDPPTAAPYAEADLVSSAAALHALDGLSVTAAALAATEVATTRPEHLVLRRKDLFDLFDTAPDLSGNDVDISRFVRDAEQVDVRLAWRDLDPERRVPDALDGEIEAPSRDELCPAPIGDVRRLLGRGRQPIWRFDPLEKSWERCRRPVDVRPGDTLLADARLGRYRPESGWNRESRGPVDPISSTGTDDRTDANEAMADDLLSHIGVWVRLDDHLVHAGEEAVDVLSELPVALSERFSATVVLAARLHDIGKAHDVFQDTMRRSAGDEEIGSVESGGPWAKSSRAKRARHRRRGFRHELAGALALLDRGADPLLDGIVERDLVVYLVAAHHGRVRLGLRGLPDETACPDAAGQALLGICEGDRLPEVATPVGSLPSTSLGLAPAMFGDGSWSARALDLRDRVDLGPFRLAFLEMLVRMADWRASAAEEAGR